MQPKQFQNLLKHELKITCFVTAFGTSIFSDFRGECVVKLKPNWHQNQKEIGMITGTAGMRFT